MAIVLKKRADIHPETLEGEAGRIDLVDVIAQPEGAPFSGGIAEIWHSAPIDFEYDEDGAVCFMLEGRITLTEGDSTYDFEPGDVVYVPQQAGLVVSWHSPDYGKFAYVTYPHWR